MSKLYPNFLSPANIGKVELKNRCIMPPMGTHRVGSDLKVNQVIIDYHKRRAEGGCALNVVEVACVHPSGVTGADLGIFDDSFIPSLRELVDAIHQAGGKAAIQLWHGGRQIFTKGQPWSSTDIPCPKLQIPPHKMTTEEVYEIIEAFGDAAVRAEKAGFDVIGVHAAHGYLIDQFVNEYSNNRDDEFGGSFENRVRFGVEVIKNIKKKLKKDTPILVRMNAEEGVEEGGLKLDEGIKVAIAYEKAGADALDVSQGCNSAMAISTPPYFLKTAFNEDNCREIKKHVSIPVICPGRIISPEIAEEVISSGAADFVDVGRAQLADPDFVKKAEEGRADEITLCVGCTQACFSRIMKGDVSCIFNPQTGHEIDRKIEATTNPKKILVIGGGPAGLEASRVAALRGHKVVLFEKTRKLGGQYLLAGAAPHKSILADAVSQMGVKAASAGVDIRLATEANPESIKEINPDEIIVCAGSSPFIPPVAGMDKLKTYVAHDILDFKDFVKEEKIAVIGGGLVGQEVAEVLAENGKDVFIVEMLDDVIGVIDILIRQHTVDTFNRLNIDLLTSTALKEIVEDGIIVSQNGEERKLDADAVVFAVGSRANKDVVDMVDKLNIPYHVAGDAVKASKILDAIWPANEIARTI